MENKFFPNQKDRLNFVIETYATEIKLRRNWVLEAARELNSTMEDGQPVTAVIRRAIDMINNAMVIVRILDEEGIGARNKERAKERARLIRERWPDLPQPPQGLRNIRNDYEHFEERLDQWAVSSDRKVIADMNFGPEVGGTEVYENLRRLSGSTLHFWSNSVDLNEVLDWALDVVDVIMKEE
jgi:hypothetical protein